MMSVPSRSVGCAVVVVHYGEPTATVRCVASVLADPSTVERSIVVVDNSGSLDAAGVCGDVTVHRPGTNLGFGAGVNAGVAARESDLPETVVFLNHDVEVQPGFLDAAVRALASPAVGAAAGPLFLDRPGGRLWYAGGGVNFLTGTVWQSRRAGDTRRAREVGFLPGAAVAVRREAWLDVGGLDPSFFLYNEDLDFCLRLRRRGWLLRFEPGMQAVHSLGAATGSGRRSALYLEHITRTRLRPFRPLAFRLYLAVVQSVYVAARAGALALSGELTRSLALLRGHVQALAAIGAGPRS